MKSLNDRPLNNLQVVVNYDEEITRRINVQREWERRERQYNWQRFFKLVLGIMLGAICVGLGLVLMSHPR